MSPTAAGVLFKLASTIAFAIMLTLIKLVSGRVPPGEILFFRSFFGIVPVIVYLAVLGVFPASLATTRPLGHVRRSLEAAGFAVARLPGFGTKRHMSAGVLR